MNEHFSVVLSMIKNGAPEPFPNPSTPSEMGVICPYLSSAETMASCASKRELVGTSKKIIASTASTGTNFSTDLAEC